jgi:hypothetical protein
MVKIRHLAWANWLVSLEMAFSMGFLAGANYPEAPVIYWVVLTGLCALAKIGLSCWGPRLPKQEQGHSTPGK